LSAKAAGALPGRPPAVRPPLPRAGAQVSPGLPFGDSTFRQGRSGRSPLFTRPTQCFRPGAPGAGERNFGPDGCEGQAKSRQAERSATAAKGS